MGEGEGVSEFRCKCETVWVSGSGLQGFELDKTMGLWLAQEPQITAISMLA